MLTDYYLETKFDHKKTFCRLEGLKYFIAPEYIEDLPWDFDSSLWNIGAIFYLLVTGNVPFEGVTFKDVINTIQSRSAYFEHTVPEEICSIIDTIFMYE
jgi:serine/threonine protein kinase